MYGVTLKFKCPETGCRGARPGGGVPLNVGPASNLGMRRASWENWAEESGWDLQSRIKCGQVREIRRLNRLNAQLGYVS